MDTHRSLRINNDPFEYFSSSFNVQRWLHPTMADGRTCLIVMPDQLPGYAPKSRRSCLFIVEHRSYSSVIPKDYGQIGHYRNEASIYIQSKYSIVRLFDC
jgi:hypothetical protein